MFYDFAIAVTPSDTESNPVEEVLKLTHGVIHRVEISFPKGTRAKVHCVLLHEEHQYLPTNPDGNFAWDGYTIVIDDYFELYTEPYSLKARCWSEADTYSYTIRVRVGVLPEEVLSPTTGLAGMFKKFLKLVGV